VKIYRVVNFLRAETKNSGAVQKSLKLQIWSSVKTNRVDLVVRHGKSSLAELCAKSSHIAQRLLLTHSVRPTSVYYKSGFSALLHCM